VLATEIVLQISPDYTPEGVAIAGIVAIAAVIGFWFLFMNQKIKETDSDIKSGEQKCLAYIQAEAERIRKEISLLPVQDKSQTTITPEIARFRDEVDSLSAHVEKIKISLDDVVEISTAHSKIISCMRAVRDWMIIVIVYSGFLGVLLTFQIADLIKFAQTILGLSVVYSSMLVFLLFRAKIGPKWIRWRRLEKILKEKGFMVTTVPKE